MDEYIRKQDAFDAVETRIAELMTHPEFRRKHLDIDLSGVIRNISAIKPADVAPVVHSQWKKYKWGEIRCPECGNRIHRIDLSGCLSFCPNCGAKMDREE